MTAGVKFSKKGRFPIEGEGFIRQSHFKAKLIEGTFYLRPAQSPEPLGAPGWSPVETGRSALRSLTRFTQRLVETFIWVIVYSPVWIAPAFLLFLLWRRLRRA